MLRYFRPTEETETETEATTNDETAEDDDASQPKKEDPKKVTNGWVHEGKCERPHYKDE